MRAVDFYGGGGAVDLDLYRTVQPKHNVPSWPPHAASAPAKAAAPQVEAPTPVVHPGGFHAQPPPAAHAAARARWLVYNSMWTVISTVSVRLKGAPWSNGTPKVRTLGLADQRRPSC